MSYAITCSGCGAHEEKRVEGSHPPTFNLFAVRTVIEDGVPIPRAECPLCGSPCTTLAHPTS